MVVAAEQQLGLEDFKGKFCTITLAEEDGTPGEPKEYLVEEANGGFFILREKGKSSGGLIEGSRILSFEPPAKKVFPLKAKRLNPVDANAVKRHLLDAHGYRVSDINGLTEEQAVELHDGIDHKDLDLGHFHALSPREQAIAASGSEADADQSSADVAVEDPENDPEF